MMLSQENDFYLFFCFFIPSRRIENGRNVRFLCFDFLERRQPPLAYQPQLLPGSPRRNSTLRRSLRRLLHPPARDGLFCRFLRSPGPFLIFSGLVLTGVILSSSYTLCYRLSSRQGTMAVFHGADTYQAALRETEAQVSHILACEYHYDQDLTVLPSLAKREAIQPTSGVTDALMETVPEVERVYTLTVDGVTVGACSTINDLNNALDTVKRIYVNDNTVAVQYDSDVTLDRSYLPAWAGTTSSDQVVNALTSATAKIFPYIVQEGDTVGSVAAAFGMTEERLEALNHDLPLPLAPGAEITVEQVGPLLTVGTVEQITSSRTIAPETQTVPDDTMYTGEERVVQPGALGEETVTTQVSCRSGQPLYRSEIHSITVTEPTSFILAMGTQPLPDLPEDGLFLWPVSGTITSNYGYRFIFGEYNFHRGVDIAAPFATPIQAAADGTVTFVGERGTYGNLVIVDHHNGFVTYYGHCSGFLVQAGDTVSRGQAIALVGSTGRSTGNHCHFEVHYQGNLVNPLQYLPGPDGTAVITNTPATLPEVIQPPTQTAPETGANSAPQTEPSQQTSSGDGDTPSDGESPDTDSAGNTTPDASEPQPDASVPSPPEETPATP